MAYNKYTIGGRVELSDVVKKSPDEKAKHALERKTVRSIRSSGLDELKELIAKGIDVEVCDEDGWPILFLAIRKNLIAHVKLLVEHGVNVSRISKGWNSLHCAVMFKRTEIAKLLIDAGVDVHYLAQGVTPALKMARFEKANDIADLIEATIAQRSDSAR